ncbi:superoxide dismutase 1 copper chaperone-like [Fopius arisanus]|uniref:Superoxide dismutase 1 copper chaperone-like n=1 Tax=Fopius arisanus TaxID=64838 RepID=A0A9R1SY49_9HYME|nr:PREDICTED: superoxide dismutase 1 copper chaperone-like [Fopius arisanus]
MVEANTEATGVLDKGNSSTSKFDGNSGQKLACGIITRSSGVFENTKRICACDETTLWDERDESQQKGSFKNTFIYPVCGNNLQIRPRVDSALFENYYIFISVCRSCKSYIIP